MDLIKDNQDRLFAALKAHERREAMRILSEYPELINLKWQSDLTPEVKTPLTEACSLGYLEVVTFLLENGADVLATGNIPPVDEIRPVDPIAEYGALDDVFPLFVAASSCNWNILKTLLSAGADVNQRTAIGQTALHVLCTYHDNDEEFPLVNCVYHPKDPKKKSQKMLLDYGADVNLCDHHGKSALHYAAQNGNKYSVKLLLKNGANVLLKDKYGQTALNYAATHDKVLTMALIDKCSFPIELVIQAYECVALNRPCPYSYSYSIDHKLLRKATLLREQHGIPKTVQPPLECFGFKTEWQTTEELEEYGDDFDQLLIPCLLARERISRENHFDVGPVELVESDSRGGIAGNKKLLNSRMRYWLDRISYFGRHLHFSDLMIIGDISLKSALNYRWFLSNDVLVKFVMVAIDSCCVIQDRLNSETKPGCVQELIKVMEHTLVTIGAVILHLMKRSDKDTGQDQSRGSRKEFDSQANYSIAKVLIDELLHRCPTVSAPLNGYASPVLTSLFKDKHRKALYRTLIFYCIRYNFQLVRMIVESKQCDINAKDSDGNTILHIMVHGLLLEMNDSVYRSLLGQLMDTALEIVRFLLVNGSYPHARNKQGKHPGDYLRDAKFHDMLMTLNPDLSMIHFNELLMKYDHTWTLKYLTARKVVDFKIPYKNYLPEALVKFVDLH